MQELKGEVVGVPNARACVHWYWYTGTREKVSMVENFLFKLHVLASLLAN